MNQMLYMQMVEQHREQLLREAEMARVAGQVEKQQKHDGMFDADIFSGFARRVSLLFPFHVGTRMMSTETVTLAESECALRTTLALMHENGVISDYDERFVQQFTQTFEQELARQGEMSRDVVAAHA